MSEAIFKSRKRGEGRRNSGPDAGTIGDGGLSVTKKNGRTNTSAGRYESQSELNRDRKPSIIKYQ